MQVQQIKTNTNKTQAFGFRVVDATSLSAKEKAFVGRIESDLLQIGDNATEAVLTSVKGGGIIASARRGLAPFSEKLQVWSSLESPNLQKSNKYERKKGWNILN